MDLNIVFHALLGAFAVLQIGDVASTEAFLSKGATEANPFIKWLIRRGLWPIGKLAVAGAAGWLVYNIGPNPITIGVLAAINVAYLFAIYINLRAANRRR